jgi:hypothetical protein
VRLILLTGSPRTPLNQTGHRAPRGQTVGQPAEFAPVRTSHDRPSVATALLPPREQKACVLARKARGSAHARCTPTCSRRPDLLPRRDQCDADRQIPRRAVATRRGVPYADAAAGYGLTKARPEPRRAGPSTELAAAASSAGTPDRSTTTQAGNKTRPKKGVAMSPLSKCSSSTGRAQRPSGAPRTGHPGGPRVPAAHLDDRPRAHERRGGGEEAREDFADSVR